MTPDFPAFTEAQDALGTSQIMLEIMIIRFCGNTLQKGLSG